MNYLSSYIQAIHIVRRIYNPQHSILLAHALTNHFKANNG